MIYRDIIYTIPIDLNLTHYIIFPQCLQQYYTDVFLCICRSVDVIQSLCWKEI